MSLSPDVPSSPSTRGPDLFFRETMSGAFSLGIEDPWEGARRGRRTRLSFQVTILVDDLDDFLAHRDHPARLVGSVSYPPWGEGLAVDAGRFNLFRPGGAGDTPHTRLMTYGLPFSHQGRAYYLAGVKTIRDDRGPDLWRDTTRLACHLHEGPDERGPVVGAGILSLGLGKFLSLLASMGSSLPDSAGRFQARLRFGRFFLGSLWELYTPQGRDSAGEARP
jgi:hypothetical protein